mmetsp:Transcript_33759/g.54015  ORF Transcript_33759/g.54015 Transcript_33759/m.54015 type:complete len:330 (-) Transcript_33759:87-1076(-)
MSAGRKQSKSTRKSSKSSHKSSRPAPKYTAVPDERIAIHHLETSRVQHNIINIAEEQQPQQTHDRFTKHEWQFVQRVLKCCDNEDEFDIYQLQAFRSQTREGFKQCLAYYSNIIKAVLCALTQIFGIIVISIDTVESGLNSKKWCNPMQYDETGGLILHHLVLKVLAFLFSSFLAYYSMEALEAIDKGMYRNLNYAENLQWINQIWLRVGFSINLFVAIIAVYGSFLVIHFSESSQDMVLNSVALFFIVELDDLLVRRKDYEQIEEFVRGQVEDANNVRLRSACRMCCKRCCNKFVSCVGWIYVLPFNIIKHITIVLCIFLPFFVAYCY